MYTFYVKGPAAHDPFRTSAQAQVCIWCKSSLSAVSGRSTRCRFCSHCGVGTTSPSPTSHELDEAYTTWYRPTAGRFGKLGDTALRWSRGTLAKRVVATAPAGPVLDIGAGEGTLVKALRSVGAGAVGIERPAGTPVTAGALPLHDPDPRVVYAEFQRIGGKWAAVVFWHSLEHLWEPGDALRHATDLLAPNGTIILALPNAASFQARLFGDRWFGRDIPRHLAHIPTRTLLAFLVELGFDIERISYLRGGQVLFGWLDGLVGSLPGRPSLYQAIRVPEARSKPVEPLRRAATLAAGALLFPVALLATVIEVAARRGGTVYVEARRLS